MAQPRTTIRDTALAVAIGAAATLAALPAWAQDCPGNPDAIGTSRTVPIDFSQYQRVGSLNYPVELPLADHEVVLTFDDGPIPPHTTKVLDVLSSQCVKALFFIVGEMAKAYPDAVRRIRADGHTIGTHSQDHPLRFDRISDAKAQWEIDEGIANVNAALGDGGGLSPFFRIPGFGRTDTVESELAARSLVVFSTDVTADDWFRRIGPSQIIARAISRLESKGKGMLLLHDIHPWTAAALPELLKQLKTHGFRVVQVVPTTGAAPAIAARSNFTVAWSMTDQEAMDNASLKPDWPQPGDTEISETSALAAPDQGAFDPHYAPAQTVRAADAASIEAGIGSTPWPYQIAMRLPTGAARLPTPSVQDIGWTVTVTEQPVDDAAAELPPNAQPTAVQQVANFGPGRGKLAEAQLRAEAPRHTEPRHARVFNHRHARARATGRQHAEADHAVTAMAAPAH